MKHRLTLTTEEAGILADRLVPIKPIDYDLHTYARIRDLYGRLLRLQTKGLYLEERKAALEA